MAREYGEGFKQPIDFDTGKPIPGSPLIGYPNTNRPGGNGYVILPMPAAAPAPESKDVPDELRR